MESKIIIIISLLLLLTACDVNVEGVILPTEDCVIHQKINNDLTEKLYWFEGNCTVNLVKSGNDGDAIIKFK